MGAMLADAGKVQIGWVHVGVELLKDQPLQCYKCMGGGHVQEQCPSGVDRRGVEGHIARECKSTPKCMVCEEDRRFQVHPPKRRKVAGEKSAGNPGGPAAGKRAPPATNKLLPQRSRNSPRAVKVAPVGAKVNTERTPKGVKPQQPGWASMPKTTAKEPSRVEEEKMDVVLEETDKC